MDFNSCRVALHSSIGRGADSDETPGERSDLQTALIMFCPTDDLRGTMAGHLKPVVMTSCIAQVSHFVISQEMSVGLKSGRDR